MKPDWKDAPEWAKWLAMDADGIWTWFQKKPTKNKDDMAYYEYGESRWEFASFPRVQWETSLEKRP